MKPSDTLITFDVNIKKYYLQQAYNILNAKSNKEATRHDMNLNVQGASSVDIW